MPGCSIQCGDYLKHLRLIEEQVAHDPFGNFQALARSSRCTGQEYFALFYRKQVRGERFGTLDSWQGRLRKSMCGVLRVSDADCARSPECRGRVLNRRVSRVSGRRRGSRVSRHPAPNRSRASDAGSGSRFQRRGNGRCRFLAIGIVGQRGGFECVDRDAGRVSNSCGCQRRHCSSPCLSPTGPGVRARRYCASTTCDP